MVALLRNEKIHQGCEKMPRSLCCEQSCQVGISVEIRGGKLTQLYRIKHTKTLIDTVSTDSNGFG